MTQPSRFGSPELQAMILGKLIADVPSFGNPPPGVFMTEPITSFSGRYRWLSNFYVSPVVVASPHVTLTPYIYASVEHAFAAAKAKHRLDHEAVAGCSTPGKAKALGRKVEKWDDWDERRVDVMANCLAAKFAPGTALASMLIATGDAELVEGNHWNDIFWGVCDGKGLNNLGILLMSVRQRLIDAKNIEALAHHHQVTPDYYVEFEEAMHASNAAGFAGASPAQTIAGLDDSLVAALAAVSALSAGNKP